jgi:hypothetical protein
MAIRLMPMAPPLDEQTGRGHDMRDKVPPVRNADGDSRGRFRIDPAAGL